MFRKTIWSNERINHEIDLLLLKSLKKYMENKK